MGLHDKFMRFMSEYRTAFDHVWSSGSFIHEFGDFVRRDIAQEARTQSGRYQHHAPLSRLYRLPLHHHGIRAGSVCRMCDFILSLHAVFYDQHYKPLRPVSRCFSCNKKHYSQIC